MVRLAPSAVNSQPWRVVMDGRSFHFYAAPTRYYIFGKSDFLRSNDLGIAMAHFALACRELGLDGKWVRETRAQESEPHLEYMLTCRNGG
jgi:nitroreductase